MTPAAYRLLKSAAEGGRKNEKRARINPAVKANPISDLVRIEVPYYILHLPSQAVLAMRRGRHPGPASGPASGVGPEEVLADEGNSVFGEAETGP